MIVHNIQFAQKLSFVIEVNKDIKFCNSLLIESVVLHMAHWTFCDIWHSGDRASWYILIIKPTRCTNFSNLFLE